MYYNLYSQLMPNLLSPMGTWPIYYGNTNLYCQQTQQAQSYANTSDWMLSQCCCNAQRMAELQNQVNALMVNAYMADAVSSGIPRPKKKLTLDELNKILFPDDPIRDWSEKTLAAIEAKYAWLNDYD